MICVGILTASDKGSIGERKDLSGVTIKEIVEGMGWEVKTMEIVPDEKDIIQGKLIRYADELGLDIVFTTGGTGFSPRDVTPEATLAVVERLVPGIPEAMRLESLKITSRAMLSRAAAGIRGRTVIINLPGSPKGVRECLNVVLPALQHGVDVLKGNTGECAEPIRSSGIPVVCFVAGKSGAGKTTLLEKVIREMVRRGYEVGTVKNDTHGFEMDYPGKDTWKFAQAGAKATAIVGPDKYALIQKTKEKKNLDLIVSLIEGVDIILVEGYRGSDKPKIEVVRREKGTEIVSPVAELIAVVTDVKELSFPVPSLDIDDFQGVADLLINKYLSSSE